MQVLQFQCIERMLEMVKLTFTDSVTACSPCSFSLLCFHSTFRSEDMQTQPYKVRQAGR